MSLLAVSFSFATSRPDFSIFLPLVRFNVSAQVRHPSQPNFSTFAVHPSSSLNHHPPRPHLLNPSNPTNSHLALARSRLVHRASHAQLPSSHIFRSLPSKSTFILQSSPSSSHQQIGRSPQRSSLPQSQPFESQPLLLPTSQSLLQFNNNLQTHEPRRTSPQ